MARTFQGWSTNWLLTWLSRRSVTCHDPWLGSWNASWDPTSWCVDPLPAFQKCAFQQSPAFQAQHCDHFPATDQNAGLQGWVLWKFRKAIKLRAEAYRKIAEEVTELELRPQRLERAKLELEAIEVQRAEAEQVTAAEVFRERNEIEAEEAVQREFSKLETMVAEGRQQAALRRQQRLIQIAATKAETILLARMREEDDALALLLLSDAWVLPDANEQDDLATLLLTTL